MLQISLTKWCVHVHPDLIRCPNFGRCRADLLFLAVACYLDSQVARVLGQCTCWFADRELHEERQVYKLHHIKLMVILLWSTYFRMRTYVDVRATPCVHSSDCASQGPCPCKFMYILFFRTTHGRLSPHPASGIAWLLATTRGFCAGGDALRFRWALSMHSCSGAGGAAASKHGCCIQGLGQPTP